MVNASWPAARPLAPVYKPVEGVITNITNISISLSRLQTPINREVHRAVCPQGVRDSDVLRCPLRPECVSDPRLGHVQPQTNTSTRPPSTTTHQLDSLLKGYLPDDTDCHML